jgi:hypothetical protein
MESDISTLFWGAAILVALFVCCLLTWKAIEWLRNRRTSDDGAEQRPSKDLEDPWDHAISRPPADYNYGDASDGSGGFGGLGGMNQREQEELFSTYAPRKVRKAMRERRKARAAAERARRDSNSQPSDP